MLRDKNVLEKYEEFQKLYESCLRSSFSIAKSSIPKSNHENSVLLKMYAQISAELKLPFIDKIEEIKVENFSTKQILFKSRVIVIENEKTSISLLTDNPLITLKDEWLASFFKDIKTSWILTSLNTMSVVLEKIPKKNIESLSNQKDFSNAIDIEYFFNLIIKESNELESSDVHLELSQTQFCVRFRSNGVLKFPEFYPVELGYPTLSKIKLLANLNISENQKPQDGYLVLNKGLKRFQFRVSSLPLQNGESIVLRILNKSNVTFSLDFLGINQECVEKIKHLINQPNGVFIVTGPTGSGKTTTLYSILNTINKSNLNILTVEDPVEYEISGITQVAINQQINLTFSSILRSFLRQDPDVVMIGEIRDSETAQIAIQASLTGHRIFASLHTNDTPSTIMRLIDMGIQPFLIVNTVKGILSQRLVRTLCPNCKQKTFLPKSHTDYFNENEMQKDIFMAGKCKICDESGFSSMKGIFELMTLSPEIQNIILEKPCSELIRKIAIEQGMLSLEKQARELLLSGETSLSEIETYLHKI